MKIGLGCIAFALATPTAFASIAFTTGQAVFIAPPLDITRNTFVSNDEFFVFQEQTAASFPLAIPLEQVSTGVTNMMNDFVGGTVPANTEFDSFYVHVDGVGNSAQIFSGSIRFTTEIFGVILTDNALDSVDLLLNSPLTIYPEGTTDRGLEFSGQDVITISEDRRTLTYSGRVSTAIDGFRIITAVPSPGVAGTALIGAIALLRRRRC